MRYHYDVRDVLRTCTRIAYLMVYIRRALGFIRERCGVKDRKRDAKVIRTCRENDWKKIDHIYKANVDGQVDKPPN